MHATTRISPLRLIAGLLIALAVIAPGATSAGAQENGLASITIYASLCPEDYQDDDYYTDCYPTPAGAGIEYTLTDLNDLSRTFSGVSGADGFGAVEGIDEDGFYQLTFDVPFPISSAPGNCSEDGAPFPVGSEYQLNLTTDNDIRCDIFISPAAENGGEDGSLTIYKTVCPVAYGGTDYYDDCYGNPVPGVTFTASTQRENPSEGGPAVSGVTGADGRVTLSLPQGTYGVEEDIPGEFIDRFFVYCSIGGERLEIGMNDVRILVDVPAGADVRCDWYNVPTDSQGDASSLTIYKTACPAGYSGVDYYRDCYNNPQAGIVFAASALKLDFEASGATNASGFVTLPLPEDNSIASPITLAEFPALEVPKGGGKVPFFVYCTVDGVRLDVDYLLVQRDPSATDIYVASISPEAGDQVRCDWYNVPPKTVTPSPSPAPTKPVVQLPNTGAGYSTESAVGGMTLSITLLVIGGVAAIAIVTRRVRRHEA